MRVPLLLLLLLLLLAVATDATRLFTLRGATQQLEEILAVGGDTETRFDPLLSGPLRHIVSVTHRPTSPELSPANYSIFFSTLDSSIYRLSYPGADPGAVNLTKVTDVKLSGAPSALLIDSFVVHLPSMVILALDISVMRIRIISIETGRWLGDLVSLPPQYAGAYLTSDQTVLYLSVANLDSIFVIEIDADASLVKGPYKIAVPAVARPRCIEVRPETRRAYVMSESGAIFSYTLEDPFTWVIDGSIFPPIDAFPYNSSAAFRPTRFLVLSSGDDFLIPDPGCSKIHHVNTRQWSALESVGDAHNFLIAPYMLALAPWDGETVVVADDDPSVLMNNNSDLVSLLPYGKSFGCKISDIVALWPWPDPPNWAIPNVWQTLLVSCGRVLLTITTDTDTFALRTAPFTSFVGGLESIVTLDVNPYAIGEYYAAGKYSDSCVTQTFASPSYAVYKGLPNPYKTNTLDALTWKLLYSSVKVIYSVAVHPALNVLCLLEQGATIRCIDSTTGATFIANHFALEFNGFDLTDIAWADDGSSLMATSTGANMVAAFSWMGLGTGFRLDVTETSIEPRAVACNRTIATCYVSGRYNTDGLISMYSLRRLQGVLIISDRKPVAQSPDQFGVIVSMKGTLIANSTEPAPLNYVPLVPVLTFEEVHCLDLGGLWINSSCFIEEEKTTVPPETTTVIIEPTTTVPSTSMPPSTTAPQSTTDQPEQTHQEEEETTTPAPTLEDTNTTETITPRTYPPYNIDYESGWFDSPLGAWMMVLGVLVGVLVGCLLFVIIVGGARKYLRRRRSRAASYAVLDDEGPSAAIKMRGSFVKRWMRAACGRFCGPVAERQDIGQQEMTDISATMRLQVTTQDCPLDYDKIPL
jgi:hypothetical protein